MAVAATTDDDPLLLSLFELRVGLTPISVTVTTAPLEFVEVSRLVSAEGVLVTVDPALLVVVTNTVLSKVVLFSGSISF